MYTSERPRAVRSPSLASDVMSNRSAATSPLPEATPPPAFVASAEASQLVSSEVDDSVHVKEQALSLLNAFLDQILYNVLATAKSVQLGRLRDAVPIVLKPRLGKAALLAADEELKEYLNDGDDEVLNGNERRLDIRTDFDLGLAWKLARLRCMVYTRLGDMEEEDEEEYIDSEQLHPGSGTYNNAAHRASSIKAASAIFLTSILEFLGEQALLYAVQNTQRRAQVPKSPVALQLNEHGPMSPPIQQSMVLDEADMFYVGRESPLSRLWRSWRRQTRPLLETSSQQFSPLMNNDSPLAFQTPGIEEKAAQEDEQVASPRQVPLPVSENDVNEIEVPGLAREIADGRDAGPTIPVPERSKRRPVSMVVNPSDSTDQPTIESPRTAMSISQKRRSRPMFQHKRSSSHPPPERKRFSGMDGDDVPSGTETERMQENKTGNIDRPSSEVEAQDTTDHQVQGAGEIQELGNGQTSRGLWATTVVAAADEIGVGVGALTTTEKSEESSTDHTAASPTMTTRTVADEMIGTKPQVMPPKDAVTGSSITSVGDFDNLHIPVEKPTLREPPEKTSRWDTSDPEDLALSSGDEDFSERKTGPAATNQSLLSNAGLSHRSELPPNPEASQSVASETAPSDNLSRDSKAINRQGMIFTTSQETMKEKAAAALANARVQAGEHEASDPRLSAATNPDETTGTGSHHLAVTVPAAASPSTETAVDETTASPADTQPDDSTVRETVASRPSTAKTTIHSSVPQRLSSDRSHAGRTHTDSLTSQYSQHSKSSSSSSRLLGFTRDQQGRPQTGTNQGPLTNGTNSHVADTPETDKELWSASPSSTRQPLRVETNTGLERDMDEAEAKKKSLEILIRGDETLHYTLTPQSARAENVPLSGHEASITDTSRDLIPKDEFSATHKPKASTDSATINGLRANPVHEMATTPVSGTRNAASESPASGVVPSSSSPTKSRSNRVQPRDARFENDTMRDLADYVRSTGPSNEQQLPKALSSRPGTSATMKTLPTTNDAARTTPMPPVPATRPMTQQSQSSKSVGARTRFQAREPTVARRSGTKDLIDFLKEGPPSTPSSPGGVNGQLSNENGRASAASTQNSSVAPRSVQESMNSSTALLASNRTQPSKVNGMSTAATPTQRQLPQRQRDDMPARKQRRVRDPYAIDDSDDEAEEQQTPAQAKRTQDESLIDFLRNTAPPAGSSPPPVLAGSSAGLSNAAAQPNNQGIRERIMRSTSKSSLNRKASINTSRPPRTDSKVAPYNRSTTQARAGSPHLSQKGRKIDSYKPTTVTHAPHLGRDRKENFARPPTSSGRTETADLADYLKNSGPVETVGIPIMRQSSIVKEEAGFLKFFSRRKAMR